MKHQRSDFTATLTKAIHTMEPMLCDFHIELTRDTDDNSVSLDRFARLIRVPGKWSLAKILTDLGPMIEKAKISIYYDAIEIDANINSALFEVERNMKYLRSHRPLQLQAFLENELND